MEAPTIAREPVVLPLLARRATALLGAGVPLTLLIDLAEPGGPRSRELYAAEHADAAWVPGYR
jgi:hypothetical protein